MHDPLAPAQKSHVTGSRLNQKKEERARGSAPTAGFARTVILSIAMKIAGSRNVAWRRGLGATIYSLGPS